MKQVNARVQNKTDLRENWEKASFAPRKGELIVYANGVDEQSTCPAIKVGDDVTPVNELKFLNDDNLRLSINSPRKSNIYGLLAPWMASSDTELLGSTTQFGVYSNDTGKSFELIGGGNVNGVVSNSSVWAYGNGRWVQYQGTLLSVSEDAQNWEVLNFPTTVNTGINVCFGDGVFALANGSLWLSSDGTSWYQHFDGAEVCDVAYNDRLKEFLVVSSSENNYLFAVNSDGEYKECTNGNYNIRKVVAINGGYFGFCYNDDSFYRLEDYRWIKCGEFKEFFTVDNMSSINLKVLGRTLFARITHNNGEEILCCSKDPLSEGFTVIETPKTLDSIGYVGGKFVALHTEFEEGNEDEGEWPTFGVVTDILTSADGVHWSLDTLIKQNGQDVAENIAKEILPYIDMPTTDISYLENYVNTIKPHIVSSADNVTSITDQRVVLGSDSTGIDVDTENNSANIYSSNSSIHGTNLSISSGAVEVTSDESGTRTDAYGAYSINLYTPDTEAEGKHWNTSLNFTSTGKSSLKLDGEVLTSEGIDFVNTLKEGVYYTENDSVLNISNKLHLETPGGNNYLVIDDGGTIINNYAGKVYIGTNNDLATSEENQWNDELVLDDAGQSYLKLNGKVLTADDVEMLHSNVYNTEENGYGKTVIGNDIVNIRGRSDAAKMLLDEQGSVHISAVSGELKFDGNEGTGYLNGYHLELVGDSDVNINSGTDGTLISSEGRIDLQTNGQVSINGTSYFDIGCSGVKISGDSASERLTLQAGAEGILATTYGDIELKTTDGGDIALNGNVKVNGKQVATLDENGKVPSAQLPSYVDDVVEGTYENFPNPGESGKIYVDTNTNKSYRWSGSQYVEIASSIALGETSATAFAGDKGKVAYDHALAKGSAYASGLYKVATNSEGHVISAEGVSADDILNTINNSTISLNTDCFELESTGGDTDFTFSRNTGIEGYAYTGSVSFGADSANDWGNALYLGNTQQGSYLRLGGKELTSDGIDRINNLAIDTDGNLTVKSMTVEEDTTINKTITVKSDATVNGQVFTNGVIVDGQVSSSYLYSSGDIVSKGSITATQLKLGNNINELKGYYYTALTKDETNNSMTLKLKSVDGGTLLIEYAVGDVITLTSQAQTHYNCATITETGNDYIKCTYAQLDSTATNVDPAKVTETNFYIFCVDKPNVGYSIPVKALSLGKDTKAYGDGSVAFGDDNMSLGNGTVAGGRKSIAGSRGAVALGNTVQALGAGSFAAGHDTIARANVSTVFGEECESEVDALYSIIGGARSKATATGAIVLGYQCEGNGNYSFTTGLENKTYSHGVFNAGGYNKVNKEYSAAIGRGLTTSTNKAGQVVVGEYNDIVHDALFIVGNGTSTGDRKNALVIDTDGNATFAGGLTTDSIYNNTRLDFNSPDIHIEHNGCESWIDLYENQGLSVGSYHKARFVVQKGIESGLFLNGDSTDYLALGGVQVKGNDGHLVGTGFKLGSSIALGSAAASNNCLAFGDSKTSANGNTYTTAIGYKVVSSGTCNIGIGRDLTITGGNAVGIGTSNNIASGKTFGLGYGITTESGCKEGLTVVGRANATDKDAIFIVGNGTMKNDGTGVWVPDAKKNAFTVKNDGSAEVAGNLTAKSITVNDGMITLQQLKLGNTTITETQLAKLIAFIDSIEEVTE